MKIHLISQVLLNRFSKNGKIGHRIINFPTSSFQKPKYSAYISLPIEIFGLIEQEFGRIESRIPLAFETLDKGTIFDYPEHINIVKRFLSLHYIRGNFFYELIRQEPKYSSKFIKEVKKNHPLEAKENANNEEAIVSNFRQEMIKSSPVQIKKLIKETKKLILNYNLEIGLAPEGLNFLMPDVPVFTMTQEGEIGIRNGAAVRSSATLAMPFGPKHIISITALDRSNYRQLSPSDLTSINSKMLTSCMYEYYFLP